MKSGRLVVVGGGAAGFFAAITCAQANPNINVSILEMSSHLLSKVRISGGGRCNVTHACFDAREMTTRYPRGERALIGPFGRFQASDTVTWFEERGVKLKIERDGRMFPVTDSSQSVIDCLLREASASRVQIFTNRAVTTAKKDAHGQFELTLSNGDRLACDALLLATGGCRAPAAGKLAVDLGHTLEPPVPSLFTFDVEVPWLRSLAGISVESAEVTVPGAGLRESGPMLITHRGLSGPVILRISAWGARALHAMGYEFPLQVNWLPAIGAEALTKQLLSLREAQPARLMVNSSFPPLPARLWESLVLAAGITRDTRWAGLSRSSQHALVQQLGRTEFVVSGKSLNKEEFVTCGGVRLGEVNFKTMESRFCPGLYFAGELLDIDGITGGFNFQSAWTTGWIAGHAVAGALGSS